MASIDIEWNYAACHIELTCRLSMVNYVSDLLCHKGHTAPVQPQLSLIYYAQVDSKLLVTLSAIGSQQADAMEIEATAIKQCMDYVVAYPDDSLLFCARCMLLSTHSGAGLNNKNHSCSRAGAHIYLSEDDTMPRWNEAVTIIAVIMKNVIPFCLEG